MYMDFLFNHSRFSGPYTLILQMIEERKLSITEISLGMLADEYIAYIEGLQKKDYRDISQFIVVAATLVLIKVKALLPGISYTETEEKQVHDLTYRLEALQQVKKASEIIEKKWGENPLFHKKRSVIHTPVFTPSVYTTGDYLYSVMMLMMLTFEKESRLKEYVVGKSVQLEEITESIYARIQSIKEFTFDDIYTSLEDGGARKEVNKEERKKEIILYFIALLHMLNNGDIDIAKEYDDGRKPLFTKIKERDGEEK